MPSLRITLRRRKTKSHQQLGRGPFSHITPSPNGKSLALMTATGVLWVVSSDFQKKVGEYDTSEAGATGQPRDVGWCGNDAIIVNWDALVLVVGPYGETLKLVFHASTFDLRSRVSDTTIYPPRTLSQKLMAFGSSRRRTATFFIVCLRLQRKSSDPVQHRQPRFSTMRQTTSTGALRRQMRIYGASNRTWRALSISVLRQQGKSGRLPGRESF